MRKDSRKRLLTVVAIVVLTGLAGWIVGVGNSLISVGSWRRDVSIRLGLDLRGGTHLVYRADTAGVASDQVTEALAGVREVIERRINAFGVSEPIVQTNQVGSSHRIIVELAGVYDPAVAIQLIGETPQLDFRQEVQQPTPPPSNVDEAVPPEGSLFERTPLTGKNLQQATVNFDPVTNSPEVSLNFDNEGSSLFADLTRRNLHKRIAIYLDGIPISAPVVSSEITNGQAVISGGFTLPEAKQLAQRLNAGALPIPISLESQQTVGPTLGRASLQKSVVAGLVGFILVVTWLVVFYRLPGLIASIALLIYAIFLLALIKLIPITLTVAGIAGAIMSVGMAVDASVLIFERFRENLRHGKTVRYSLEDGFKGAWGVIRDSNVSSLITAVILYTFGTSIIRGFAVTLSLGIVLSMLTAVLITKTFLLLIISYSGLHKPWLLAVREITRDDIH